MCAMEETAHAARSGCATTTFMAHDVPGHPERPARIRALEAEMSAARLVRRVRGCRRPRSSVRCWSSVHPGGVRRVPSRSCARSGGGAIDADTYAVPGTYAAALRAAGGAVQLVDALLGGEADVGVSALRPPGHHAEAARAMGFCFFGNAAVAARRATVGARALAGDDRRLGRPPRQRDQRHLPCGQPTCCSSRSTSRRCIRGRARVRRGVGGRRGLHREPAGAGRERGRRRTGRWSSTSRRR